MCGASGCASSSGVRQRQERVAGVVGNVVVAEKEMAYISVLSIYIFWQSKCRPQSTSIADTIDVAQWREEERDMGKQRDWSHE